MASIFRVLAILDFYLDMNQPTKHRLCIHINAFEQTKIDNKKFYNTVVISNKTHTHTHTHNHANTSRYIWNAWWRAQLVPSAVALAAIAGPGTTNSQSGFICMIFYRRDTHVAEIQMGTPANRLEDACAPDHFDVNKLPFVTLLGKKFFIIINIIIHILTSIVFSMLASKFDAYVCHEYTPL